MAYADAPAPGEDIVEDKGVKIFIEPKAVLFLLGTQMDYKADKLSSGFSFNNPNQTSACGCGESVAITPVTMDFELERDRFRWKQRRLVARSRVFSWPA